MLFCPFLATQSYWYGEWVVTKEAKAIANSRVLFSALGLPIAEYSSNLKYSVRPKYNKHTLQRALKVPALTLSGLT